MFSPVTSNDCRSQQRIQEGGARFHSPPPWPVKNSHKKDGHRERQLIFHISCPVPLQSFWIHYWIYSINLSTFNQRHEAQIQGAASPTPHPHPKFCGPNFPRRRNSECSMSTTSRSPLWILTCTSTNLCFKSMYFCDALNTVLAHSAYGKLVCILHLGNVLARN